MSTDSTRPPTTEPLRSVHTTTLTELLRHAGISVLISTYQACKLIVARVERSTAGDVINTHFRNFDTPMGIALDGGRLAVGTKLHIREFHNQPDVARTLDPPGSHDGCFLSRHSVVTGQIGIHDIAWAGEELWIVNTRFSCLCTRDPRYSFVPRWRPKFVSALAPEDRCHLNGLAMRDGQPRYVTALGETDTQGGWRENKARGGCLMDVESHEIIARGLSMPHSPRWHEGKLWMLESGVGSLAVVDLASGKLQTIALTPGFTRGLDFYGPYAFIGLSKVRQSSMFSGLPITDRLRVEERACGMWVIDTRNGQTVAFLRFDAGVEEVFAVQALPRIRWPDVLTDDQPAVAEAFLLPDEVLRDIPAGR